jgi:hypothetical protein
MLWAFFAGVVWHLVEQIPSQIQLSKIGFCERPIDQFVQISLYKLGTHVAVVDVVSVLPNVHSQQGFVARCQRCACGAHVDDVNAAVSFLDQPSPT